MTALDARRGRSDASGVSPADGLLPVRFILNTFISGPQAWFFLADDRGYFADEGLSVSFTEGDTLANAVPRLTTGDYDAGYGDMNALIEMAATGNADAPVAVYMAHNRPPYTIAVASDGPVRDPAGLAGRKLVTHPNDAAWRLFPEFCRATGLDPDSVEIEVSDLPHKDMVPLMLEGRWDGIFGFVNTIGAQTVEAGLDPASVLRHFEWREHVPALYGGAVMVARAFRNAHPEAVGGLVRAINRGVRETLADPDSAIDAVVRRNPSIDRQANAVRLKGTIALEMGHPEVLEIGLGDASDARLADGAKLIAEGKPHTRAPAPADVFDRSFLPPLPERQRPV
ncbi:ABC transporter substrate-binding protein [Amaricoccus macauensis]|uniref:ABC transporter substrate-binding protein n=1 Tax=Amaricoccus macauensis TaxID=57001 RepID=UPI003C7E7F5B